MAGFVLLAACCLAGQALAAPGDVTVSRVADLDPGSEEGNPTNLFNAGGTLMFAADDGAHGTELWKSNGGALGPGGTEMLPEISPGSGAAGSSNPSGFAGIGATVFFAASDGSGSLAHGSELWKTEPPYTSATMVDDINPAPGADSSPEDLINVNGTLLFRADDGSDDEELWKSAPPYTSATEVIDINNTGASFPDELTDVSGILFFIADDGNGDELWKSEAPFDTATMVKDIDDTGTAVPADLTNVNGTLLFSASDSADGQELWKSTGPDYDDGSTVQVEDINATAAGVDSNPVNLTNVAGTLFFEADDGLHGQDLWKSASPYTDVSTDLIDINPGGPSSASDPDDLTDLGGTLFLFGPWRDRRHRAVEVQRRRAGRRDGPGGGHQPDGALIPLGHNGAGRSGLLPGHRRNKWPRALEEQRHRGDDGRQHPRYADDGRQLRSEQPDQRQRNPLLPGERRDNRTRALEGDDRGPAAATATATTDCNPDRSRHRSAGTGAGHEEEVQEKGQEGRLRS